MPAPTDYLRARAGIRSWLLTTDHKRIAIMFFVATTLAVMLGGTFAMLLRTKLLFPGPAIMEPLTYNQLFTMHGIIMVFMFMIPAIPAVFGNFFLPIMLGAKDLAFPRINLASFYVYIAGATLTLWGMIHGGADTGWTFYAPYATASPTDVAPVAIGVFVLGVSSIMTGFNFIATTHMLRAQGHALARHADLRVDDVRHQYHPGDRDARARALGDPGRARSRAAHGHVRSGARRRSGAVRAPVLVLLPPRGLHHDLAGDGRGRGGDPDVRAQEAGSRTTRSRTRRSASRSSAF